MMSRMILLVMVVALMLSFALPAFAATGAGGAGAGYGLHHADHAVSDGGFTGGENPGMHEGFHLWPGT